MVTASLSDLWRRRKLTIILGFLVLCTLVVFVHLRVRPLKKGSKISSKLDTKLETGHQTLHGGFGKGQGKAKGRVKAPGPFINNGMFVKKKLGQGNVVEAGGMGALEKQGKGLAAGMDVLTERKDNNVDDSKKVVKVDGSTKEKLGLDISPKKNRQGNAYKPEGGQRQGILRQGEQKQGINGGEVEQELGSQLNRNQGLKPIPNEKSPNGNKTQLVLNMVNQKDSGVPADDGGVDLKGGNLRDMGVNPSGGLNGGNGRNMGVNPSGGLNGGNGRNMGVNPSGGLNGGNRRNMGVNPSGGLNGGNRRNMGVNPSGGLNGGNRRNMGVNPSGGLNGGNGRNMGVNPSGGLNGGNRRNMGVNPSGGLNGGNGRNMGVNPSGGLNGGNRHNMGVNPSGGLNGGNGRNMGVNPSGGLNGGNRRNMGVNPSGGLNGGNRRNMGVDPSGGLNGGNRRNMGVNPSGGLNGGNGRNMGVNPSGGLNGGNRRNMGVDPSGGLNGGNRPVVGAVSDNLGGQEDLSLGSNQKQQRSQVTSRNRLYVTSSTLTGSPLSTRLTEHQEAVVQAFKHAWKAYKTYAWGMDEVNPAGEDACKPLFGLGMTLVDSLDTMWLMGLKEEFNEAREWVAKNFNLDKNQNTVNVFETTIRVMGGLLSAYHLSEDELFLDKAVQLGHRLLPAFQTTSDIPSRKITLISGKHERTTTSVAEAGSLQLEFRDLSRASGNPIFKQACDAAMEQIMTQGEGLVPQELDVNSGRFSRGLYTVGAGTDSYYEYLLKQWLQSGKTETKFRDAYLASVKQVLNKLVGYSKPSNMAFLGSRLNLDKSPLSSTMDHLSCFYPGMLALGAIHQLVPEVTKLAENLTHTCYYMYSSTEPTHLAPEMFHFNTQPTSTQDVATVSSDIGNFLRPETVESLFYLYRLTKNKIYQEWGWQIFQAFEEHSKLEKSGYTSLLSVYLDKKYGEKMDSYFMAETLKYLFLLFGEDDSFLALDEWVFNTEAHPLPIWRNTPKRNA